MRTRERLGVSTNRTSGLCIALILVTVVVLQPGMMFGVRVLFCLVLGVVRRRVLGHWPLLMELRQMRHGRNPILLPERGQAQNEKSPTYCGALNYITLVCKSDENRAMGFTYSLNRRLLPPSLEPPHTAPGNRPVP